METIKKAHQPEQGITSVEEMRRVLGNVATASCEPTERQLQKRGYRVSHLVGGVLIDWLRLFVNGDNKSQVTVDMRPVGSLDITELVHGYSGPVMIFDGHRMTPDDTKLHLAECRTDSIILSSYHLTQD